MLLRRSSVTLSLDTLSRMGKSWATIQQICDAHGLGADDRIAAGIELNRMGYGKIGIKIDGGKKWAWCLDESAIGWTNRQIRNEVAGRTVPPVSAPTSPPA